MKFFAPAIWGQCSTRGMTTTGYIDVPTNSGFVTLSFTAYESAFPGPAATSYQDGDEVVVCGKTVKKDSTRKSSECDDEAVLFLVMPGTTWTTENLPALGFLTGIITDVDSANLKAGIENVEYHGPSRSTRTCTRSLTFDDKSFSLRAAVLRPGNNLNAIGVMEDLSTLQTLDFDIVTKNNGGASVQPQSAGRKKMLGNLHERRAAARQAASKNTTADKTASDKKEKERARLADDDTNKDEERKDGPEDKQPPEQDKSDDVNAAEASGKKKRTRNN